MLEYSIDPISFFFLLALVSVNSATDAVWFVVFPLPNIVGSIVNQSSMSIFLLGFIALSFVDIRVFSIADLSTDALILLGWLVHLTVNVQSTWKSLLLVSLIIRKFFILYGILNYVQNFHRTKLIPSLLQRCQNLDVFFTICFFFSWLIVENLDNIWIKERLNKLLFIIMIRNIPILELLSKEISIILFSEWRKLFSIVSQVFNKLLKYSSISVEEVMVILFFEILLTLKHTIEFWSWNWF